MKYNRISYYYINNNNMTNHTKGKKKTLKRGKRSFKKRGGSVKKQRSRAKTPSTKKRNQRNHIYEKVTNYSPTPYARLHGKKKTLKKNKGSPVYDNLQRVKGPVQPGTDTLLDNEIAEGKRGMKLKGGVNGSYGHLNNKKKPSKSYEHIYNVLNRGTKRGSKVKKLVKDYENKINAKKPESKHSYAKIPSYVKQVAKQNEIPFYVVPKNSSSLKPGYKSEQKNKLATYETPLREKIPTPYNNMS
jgi:hypothetical protein